MSKDTARDRELAEREAKMLRKDCPFCKAPAGQRCKARFSGTERWPHAQRQDLIRPVVEVQAEMPIVLNALCCACGNVRTIKSTHHPARNDPNRDEWAGGVAGRFADPRGWRNTCTLKCEACGKHTRHARLADPRWRDQDEQLQRMALGDGDSQGWHTSEGVKRLRQAYRAMPFPRNPRLTHRWYRDEAERAWDDGTKRVIGLCGEEMTVDCDPRRARKYGDDENRVNGFLVAQVESEVELTDLDTGLSWIAMQCVDCCRVSNRELEAQRRQRLRDLLVVVTCDTGHIPVSDLHDLIRYLEESIAERLRTRKGNRP